MDATFLDFALPHQVRLPSSTIGLPILYRDVAAMTAYFPVSLPEAAKLLPEGSGLRPVMLLPGKAVMALAAFDYKETSIGAYGEVAVGILASTRRMPPFLTALAERYLPDVGIWVHRLPVTTPIALEAGVTLWGYPKFIGDIRFRDDGDTRTCELDAEGQSILRLSVHSGRGRIKSEARPFRTFTIKNGKLLRTTIQTQARYQVAHGRDAARLELGDHPYGREIAALRPGRTPLEARWMSEMQSILPAADRVVPLGRA